MLKAFFAGCLLLPLLCAAQEPAEQFTNPILWEDFADIDIFRVNDTYYYSASNLHYTPGAPILRSYDLVNWEVVSHSVPFLDSDPKYNFDGGQGYAKGTYASYLTYRPSTSLYYWGGCIDFNKTHFYTAETVEGPWTKQTTSDKCYYDAGILIDDDDTMFVAYGNTNISVAQLTEDGFGEVKSQRVFDGPFYIEGARFYKINGYYIIFVTRVADGQFVLKADNPFGPYEFRAFLDKSAGPIPNGGVPHQGGLVQTQAGDWYYMSFIDAYPGGRVPALAPVTIDDEGWPVLQLGNPDNVWQAQYPKPNIPPSDKTVRPPTGIERFDAGVLPPPFEWNHNPDPAAWSILPAPGGLRLAAASVTDDLYRARNTITHRTLGPASTATLHLDFADMTAGDRAGFALLRDYSAWVGIVRDADAADRLAFVSGLDMDADFNTNSTGAEVGEGVPVPEGAREVWLRVAADIAPASDRKATFWYSFDGEEFVQVGDFTMGLRWQFFMGYRFAAFNYATEKLGGAVTVRSFELKEGMA